MPPAAGGFPQTPLTEEFETQEVRKQLYICEVLHVGHNIQHITNGVKTSQRTSHSKAEKKNFFGVRPMLLELDLSKREVLHLLAPLVSSYACGFMTYHHIRDVFL